MANEKGIVRIVPKAKQEITVCSNCGHADTSPAHHEPETEADIYKKYVGRIAIFELSTGTRVQGKILVVTEKWIDTDNGAVKVENIVHAKWVSDEEARIIRGGPLRNW